MGRPPIGPSGTVPVNVQITPELLARMDAAVGRYGRSRLVREAVEAELARREKSKD